MEGAFDNHDRMIHVLSKNIQKAIERKQEAVFKYIKAQKELAAELESYKNIVPENIQETNTEPKLKIYLEENKNSQEITNDEEAFLNCDVIAEEYSDKDILINLPQVNKFENK